MVEMNLKCSLGCCKLMFSLVAIKKRLTHIRPVILLERPRPYTRVSICFIPLCFASDLVILAFSLISIISSIIIKKKQPRMPFRL